MAAGPSSSLGRRVLWFVGIWALSVLALAVVSGIIRWWLGLA